MLRGNGSMVKLASLVTAFANAVTAHSAQWQATSGPIVGQ